MAMTDFLSCCLVLICISWSCVNGTDFKFLTSKKAYLVALAGNTFNFDCKTSDPSAKVALWKKFQESDTGDNISEGNRVKLNGQVFKMYNLTVSDGGIYFCKATNSNGQNIEKNIGILFISQGGSKHPMAHIETVSKIAEAMSDVNFTCYSFGDAITHTWSKDGRILPQSQIKSHISRTKHGLTLEKSILYLHQVTPADDGKYICKVNTSFTPGYQHNATAILQVKAIPLDWNRSTELFDTHAIFYVGDPLEIDCSLNQPWVNVSLWKKNGGKYSQIIPVGHIRKVNQKFIIDEIRLVDAGRYQCRTAKIHPSKKLMVYVFLDGIPRPKPTIKYNKRPKVHLGDDISLNCLAIGQVILTWYKIDINGTKTKLNSTNFYHLLPTNKYETINTLTIKNFNGSDDGFYRCLLTRNYVTWRYHDEVYLSVKGIRKPNFSDFPGTAMFAVEGSSFYFHYKINGSPPPSIFWYKVHDDNKEELLVSGVMKSWKVHSPGLEVNENHFSISRTSYPRDDMLLKCVAKNVAGSVNRTLRITIKAKPKIAKGKDEIDTIHMVLDAPKTNVVCTVSSANPRILTYKWEIQFSQYNCKLSECKPGANWKLVVPSSASLYHINSNSRNSTLTLLGNRKNVFTRCTAINDVGQSNHTWKVLILSKPKIRAVKKTVVTDEGTNVHLSCKSNGFEKIIWKRNNIIVSQNSRYSLSENTSIYSLRIRNANVTDGGIYQCIGIIDDKDNSKDEIFLTVQEMKVPFVNLISRVLNNGSSFIIPCNVTGHPTPTITWTKDGKILSLLALPSKMNCISAVSDIYRMAKDNAVLIVCKADYEKHSGWFMCNARNRLGNHSAKAYIEITAAPKIESPSKGRKYDVKEGESFLLPCLSKGNPAPRVWWEKKEEGKGFQRQENMRGRHLNFTSVEKTHLGSYQCVAENKFGRKNSTIYIELDLTLLAARGSAFVDNSKTYTVVIGCVSFFVLAIIIIVAVVLYKRKKAYGGFYILNLPPLPDYIKKLDPGTPLTEQTNKLPYDAQWEFPRNRLKFYRELGAGAFGKVFLAEGLGIVAFDPRGSIKRRSSKRRFGGSTRRNDYVNNNKVTKVAVKTLKEDSGAAEYKDLLSELKILIHVGEHKNIVNLLGACTKGRESELWIIIEYCSNGNLLQFLRNRRDIYEAEWKGVSKDPNHQLTMTDLVIAAYQVARGMDFLASRMCIHRDLATRNILVTENYVIKIADFGLARDVGTDSQYVKTSTGLLPIKWMAIEAIIDRLFTEKSDVWSFGIVLWELFTLGGTPYPNISPNEVSEFLAAGNRMDQPHLCPEEIGSLMSTCWHDDRNNRPTFKELVQILDKIIEVNTSTEAGCGYLEVQGDEGKNEYLRPSEVKSPHMDPFELNSPLPPIPSPGDNESDSLLERDQNARHKKFNFDKSAKNRGRKDSELEKARKDGKPENSKDSDGESSKGSDIDGYIDTSLTGKEKERIERDLDKDRDSCDEPRVLDDYAYWKKPIV